MAPHKGRECRRFYPLCAADLESDAAVRDRNVRHLSRLHRVIFELTGGRIGDRLVNNDMLLLTTTGARTEAPHTVPLLYLEDADDMVVFASYGGRANHPQWYLNLVANPSVSVQVGATAYEAMARTTHGGERARLWERALSAYHGYGEYQQKTVREIPVVVLHPL